MKSTNSRLSAPGTQTGAADVAYGRGAQLLRSSVFGVAILLAPLILIPGTVFNPAVGGIGAGSANIAANHAASALTNQWHVAAYVLETFLLPLSVLGLAGLAMGRSPWLATIGGGLGLIGWLPWSALTAQDDLTLQMAQVGTGQQFVALWNRFTTDGTMMAYLLIYVVAHLAAYVILPIALRRAGVIPRWAAWALALTSPITIASFATRQHALLYVVLILWIAASAPAAKASFSAVNVWRQAYGNEP